jgi:hypothetical protein
MYWIATFIWDILLYSALSGLIMGIFYLYGGGATKTFLFSSETAAATFMLLWMYGLGSIPLAYLYSWMFDNASTAQIGKHTRTHDPPCHFAVCRWIILSAQSTVSRLCSIQQQPSWVSIL